MKRILFALLLSGCVIPQQIPPGPPEWQQGYLDGCESGESAAGYVYARWKKDVQRSTTDELYKQGWQDAYDRCKSTMQDTKAIVRGMSR